MNDQLITALAQFGPAGLIGLLWIAERRNASARDRRLAEAHQKLMAQDQSLEAVLNVVKDNTRAIATLEQTQRRLIELAQEIVHRRVHRKAAGGGI